MTEIQIHSPWLKMLYSLYLKGKAMKYVLVKSLEKRRAIAKSCVLDFARRLLKVNSIVPGKACEQAGTQFT